MHGIQWLLIPSPTYQPLTFLIQKLWNFQYLLVIQICIDTFCIERHLFRLLITFPTKKCSQWMSINAKLHKLPLFLQPQMLLSTGDFRCKKATLFCMQISYFWIINFATIRDQSLSHDMWSLGLGANFCVIQNQVLN